MYPDPIVATLTTHIFCRYAEEPGKPHWWFEVLKNARVQAFLDRVHCASYNTPMAQCREFTLTVAVPAESGSMRGWRVLALEIPGRSVLSSYLVSDFMTVTAGLRVWKYAKMMKEE